MHYLHPWLNPPWMSTCPPWMKNCCGESAACRRAAPVCGVGEPVTARVWAPWRASTAGLGSGMALPWAMATVWSQSSVLTRPFQASMAIKGLLNTFPLIQRIRIIHKHQRILGSCCLSNSKQMVSWNKFSFSLHKQSTRSRLGCWECSSKSLTWSCFIRNYWSVKNNPVVKVPTIFPKLTPKMKEN